MERSQFEAEVTGLKERVTVLSSEVSATVANHDRALQQLSARISWESQIRQMLAGWFSDRTGGGSGYAATS